MKIKRMVQGTALAALAAAAWMGAGSDASASSFPISDVSINEENGNICVGSTAKEIMVSVLKAGKGKTEAKITSWDVYEGGSADIDLSKLKNASDNYIAIKTDDTEPIVLHIKASNSKYKAEYHANEQKVNITNGTEGASYEYRTTYGNSWDSLSLAGFGREFQYQGATIYVREVGNLSIPNEASTTKFKDVTIKTTPKELDMYDIGALHGKEIKFNIAKEANGPSVAADYTKGIVKIKKGLEWRFVTATSVGTTTAAVEADGKTGKSVNEIVGEANEGTLEVRKEATGTGKKGKVASKWTRVKVQKLEDISGKAAGTDVSTVTTGASEGVNILTYKGASVNAKFDYDSGKNKIKSLVITNGLTSDIEYVIKDTKPTVADKAKKIAKSKSAKFAEKNAGQLWVRIAGNKKEQVWVTDYVSLGKITFPK